MITSGASAAHHAPRGGRGSITVVIVGATAAPVLWLAQMLLSYGISADVCGGLEWATALFTRTALQSTLFALDAIAGCGAIGGGLLSYRSWRLAGNAGAAVPPDDAKPGQDGMRFLAQCGMLSSLWFFGAIMFNTIASLMIAPCVR
jgi:hypothetical protein